MEIACPTCATAYDIDDASVGGSGRKVRCSACGTVWRAFQDRPSELISAPEPSLPPAPVMIAAPPPLAPTEEDVLRAPDEPPPPPEVWDASAHPLAEFAPAEGGETGMPPEAATEPESATEAPLQQRKARIVDMAKARQSLSGSRLKALASMPVLAVVAMLVLAGAAISQRERVVRLVPQAAAVFSTIGAPVNLRGIEIRDVKSRLVDDGGVNVLVIEGVLASTSPVPVGVPRLRFAVIGDKGQELYVWTAQADKGTLGPGDATPFRRRLAAPPTEGRDVSVRFLNASDITAGLK